MWPGPTLVMALAFALATPGAAAPATTRWRSVAAGIEHLHLAEYDAELLRFDLERHRVDVVVPGAARPATAAAMRAERDALVAFNGGFFDTDGRPLGLRIGGGATVLRLRPRVDWGVLAVRAGRASIVHSRAWTPDDAVVAAVQCGPRILVEGRVTQLKPQAARRTAVALDASGRFLTVVVTRARVEARALGEALAALGFRDAMMLDGGPSTQLSAAAGAFRLEVPGGYPVPDGLVILPAR